nr:phage portal protein [Pararoseomonas indoligenes]
MPLRRPRASALINGSRTPYDAADTMSAEMSGWNPWLGSPDTETTPYRDQSVARIRDLVRNDGWASGAIMRITDATIGSDFRLSAMPDYRHLQRQFGRTFDAVWAKEFRDAAEAGWRVWANDPGRYCDTSRRLTFGQMARLAFRHYLVEGEALAVLAWRPDRMGYGRARYATTLQLLDPDRLSNPSQRMDTLDMRGGIELDQDGVPIAYHIRRAHLNDWFAAGQSVQWERLPREEEWGRPVVVHHFDSERAGQHRPVGGILTPVLARMRMLAQYDRVELQAAMVNAIFGAYVKSPFDATQVQAAMDDSDEGMLSNYQAQRADFHADRRLMAGDVRMPTLFPGEDIATISANRPAAAFDMFESAMLRHLAAQLGMAYVNVSGDYRGSSYSSARQATIVEGKTVDRRRMDFGASFCTPVYVALLEEMIDRGDVPMPAGAPEFAEARFEYARCRWMGPGRGWVDPVAEVEGARAKISAGLSTLQQEIMESGGEDWEEVLEQRALEEKTARALGLDLTIEVTGGQQPQRGSEPSVEQALSPTEARIAARGLDRTAAA